MLEHKTLMEHIQSTVEQYVAQSYCRDDGEAAAALSELARAALIFLGDLLDPQLAIVLCARVQADLVSQYEQELAG